jgi:hypothetical protein
LVQNIDGANHEQERGNQQEKKEFEKITHQQIQKLRDQFLMLPLTVN